MLPHLLFGRTRDILYIMGAIAETNVSTCLDTGHANLAGDLSSVIHKLSCHLRMVHANDNHGDWDAHLPPGEGNIDWHRVIGALELHNFRGAFILELSGKHGRDYAATLQEARQARRFLLDVCRALDEGQGTTEKS